MLQYLLKKILKTRHFTICLKYLIASRLGSKRKPIET